MSTRVLMVGKSNAVMAEMARDMGPEFDVRHTEDVREAAAELDPRAFDVVILGRALKPDGRQALLRAIEETDGRLAVLTSLAPCGKLSAAHARAAMSAATGRTTLTAASVRGSELTFDLTAPARVTVTLYTLTALRYILKVKPILTRDFPAGRQALRIPRTLSDRFERKHLYVAADDGDAFLLKMRGL